MSDLLIKGMEMPTRCAECRLSTVHSFKDRPLCDVLVEYMSYGEWEAKRLDNCPLVPVPPHWDLIDRDALPTNQVELEDIVNAPTSIEADEADMDSFIRIFEEDDEEDGMDSFIRILKD